MPTDIGNPPSILFVLPWDLSAAGGVNQVVINLAREAARRDGLRPIIFSMDWSQPDWEHDEINGIERVRGRQRAPLGAKQPLRHLVAFASNIVAEIRAWRAFLDDRNVQVVNLHYPVMDYFVFAMIRAFGRTHRRLIVSIHGADITGIQQMHGINRFAMDWMLRRADEIVACSQDLARRARAILRFPEGGVCAIANGIDVEELERSRNSSFRPTIGEHESYLVSVGTFEHKKGQDLLLQAYRQLRDGGLTSALVLIGRYTPYLQSLRDLARQLQLGEHAFFYCDLDHQDTLNAIRQARMLVQPSREEPFGITLLEAGYLGTPIVAARTGGIPEVVGQTYPFLFEPNDPAALASTIDQSLSDEHQRAQCAAVMQERVTAQFTWDRAFSAYESHWHQRT